MENSMLSGTIACENSIQSFSILDAQFLGWQEALSKGDFALYTISANGHPSYGSTVSEEDLREMNLRVPDAPMFERHTRKL